MHAFLWSLICFVFVLGVLVSIHELGHYLAARWRGVHVDVFSIGFGKPLYRWHDRVGTEWRICPIPLGGYVKPHGFEDPEDVTEEERAAWIPGKTFHEKPVGSRAIVIAAGPAFNFLLAIILFAAVFAISGKPTDQPVVNAVMPNSAASQAGLQPHDIITRIDGINQPDVLKLIEYARQHPGKTTELVVQRSKETITLPMTISSVVEKNKTVGKMGIGLAANPVAGKPMPIGTAFVAATKETWNASVQIVVGIGQLITGQRSAKELGGVVQIAQLSGKIGEQGFVKLVYFMGILSINLGLINLFPIPVLDGGRLFFYAFEAIFRRPVPKPVQVWSFQIGFALIALLFLFSMYNDMSRLGIFHWFTGHSK